MVTVEGTPARGERVTVGSETRQPGALAAPVKQHVGLCPSHRRERGLGAGVGRAERLLNLPAAGIDVWLTGQLKHVHQRRGGAQLHAIVALRPELDQGGDAHPRAGKPFDVHRLAQPPSSTFEPDVLSGVHGAAAPNRRSDSPAPSWSNCPTAPASHEVASSGGHPLRIGSLGRRACMLAGLAWPTEH